ncbi:polysaccharide pyruvyl transferase family protein [Mesorhizobium sp. WSM3224]|uniref:polysaccharide pyruvyl transferase family protein n=1 Tax=Mesorhizobium sp. WSM3224 TaxID=1040986 RepID=UPI00041D2652|nr:polysaccharide pyruvyl transferase family protein [Mesorhizobium sp. WSM3224]
MLSQDSLDFFRFDIASCLRQYSGKKICFFPNPGNAGDSLIAVGTYQAFERCGLEVEIIDLDSNVKDQIVFLGGGGNFVPLYTDVKTAFKKFLGRASKCILLPHTIRGNEDVIASLDDSCTVFCRDLASFRHLRAVNPSLEVRLSHDMAFHIDVRALLDDEETRIAAQNVLTEKLNSLGLTEGMIRGWPSVDMLRLDSESCADAPQSDVDVSDLFALGVRPNEARLAAWCFLKTISFAKHITTDRLHVGVAAAMLGVPCTLRDNSYGKNHSVYEHSLKHIAINNNATSFRFKPGTLSAASDEPKSLALSRHLDQKVEVFETELQQMTLALATAQQELRRRSEALAEAQQQLTSAAVEREKLISELARTRQDLMERTEGLANADAELGRIKANWSGTEGKYL